jgi:hypothetical protein
MEFMHRWDLEGTGAHFAPGSKQDFIEGRENGIVYAMQPQGVARSFLIFRNGLIEGFKSNTDVLTKAALLRPSAFRVPASLGHNTLEHLYEPLVFQA